MGHSSIRYSGCFIGCSINFDKGLGNSKYAFENYRREERYSYYYNEERECYECNYNEEENENKSESESETENESEKVESEFDESSSILAIKMIRKEWSKYLKKFHPELNKKKMPDFFIICTSYISTYEPIADSSVCRIVWGKYMNDKDIKIVSSESGEHESESFRFEYKFPANSKKIFADFMTHLKFTYSRGIKTIY